MKSRRMDERIEAFLLDVLQDEGESSRLVCENTRRTADIEAGIASQANVFENG